MTRKVSDCSKFPSEKNRTLVIAGEEEEVLRVVMRHAVEEHGHENASDLREKIRGTLGDA